MRVYLCGPIKNCTDEETHEWRNMLIKKYPCISFLNPAERDYRDMLDKPNNTQERLHLSKRIVECDLRDIRQSDVIFANLWKTSVGSVMELVYAYKQGIPILSIVPSVTTVSPWIIYHSTHIFDHWQDAFRLLESYIEQEGRIYV